MLVESLARGSPICPNRSGLKDHVALLRIRAAWVKPIFEARLRTLADAVNSANGPRDCLQPPWQSQDEVPLQVSLETLVAEHEQASLEALTAESMQGSGLSMVKF